MVGGLPGLKPTGKLTAEPLEAPFFLLLLNNMIFPFKEETSAPTWLRSQVGR